MPPKAAPAEGRPKGADAPMNQSREAHHSARPLHSPEGASPAAIRPPAGEGGTRVAGVGSSVGFRVGVNALGHRGTGPGPAGLRSLPAQQHAPKARPSPATDCGRRGVVPGRPSSTNGCTAWTCAVAGCRTFALDGRASCPAGTTAPRAIRVASKPGLDIPRSSLSTGRRLLLLPVSSKEGWSSRSPCGLGRLPIAG
jgi:hypothetical protein